jgi:excisionase family DNA binding protein
VHRRIVFANLRKAARPISRGHPATVTGPVKQQSTSQLGLTVSQAALHLGVSVATVRRWSNAGHLKGSRTPGGQRRFTVEQLDEFVDSLQPRSR